MDPNTKNTALGAAGAGAAAGLGVEDVFSTWLYTGTGSTQTITNGIDLSGEGGMVWFKNRTSAWEPSIFDTERGPQKYSITSGTANYDRALSGDNDTLSSFNNNGFTVESLANVNGSGDDYASWTFRKAPGFFDVVTYSGNGSTQTISHNLGSVPGCIIVKAINASRSWAVYHKSLGNSKKLYLNLNNAENSFAGWNYTTPTASEFYVGADSDVNNSAYTYVAYLFADDEAVFGENADQSIIKCGSYTGTGSEQFIDLGWEPQFLLHKPATYISDWKIFDNMRGWSDTAQTRLNANESAAESTATADLTLTSTGFRDPGIPNGSTVTYVAIRRGPMKTPTDATTVFDIKTKDGATTLPAYKTSFPVDITLRRNNINSVDNADIVHRLTSSLLYPSLTNAEGAYSSIMGDFAFNNGYDDGAVTDATDYGYLFRRAPGFFDVVAYTGTGSATTVNHNLGVAPELMIVKQRSGTAAWVAYCSAVGNNFFLPLTDGGRLASGSAWNNTTPTSSVFTVGTNSRVNTSTSTYIAYLFATVSGVSKVGSYSGTGSNINVDCGFSAGARFVLIKRTDSTGDWYVWDTARGIVSGNDPYWLLNGNAAQVTTTDYIDPYTSGFTVTSTAPAALNASGGNYIFLAIA